MSADYGYDDSLAEAQEQRAQGAEEALAALTKVFVVDMYDRESGWNTCVECGVFLTEAGAEAKALELNQKEARKRLSHHLSAHQARIVSYNRDVRAWKTAMTEHDALVAAGLRSEHQHRRQPPVKPELDTARGHGGVVVEVDGHKVRLTDEYYGTDELEVHQ